jgi:hypothetical protein
MRRAIPALLLLIATLAGCGESAVDSKVSETRIDDLDSLEGTISDEMVDTGSLNETAVIDNSEPDDDKPTAKKPEAKKEAKAERKPAPKPGPAADE